MAGWWRAESGSVHVSTAFAIRLSDRRLPRKLSPTHVATACKDMVKAVGVIDGLLPTDALGSPSSMASPSLARKAPRQGRCRRDGPTLCARHTSICIWELPLGIPEPQPRLPMVSIEKPRLPMEELLRQASADVAKEGSSVTRAYLRWTKTGNRFAGIVQDCIVAGNKGRHLLFHDENGTPKSLRRCDDTPNRCRNHTRGPRARAGGPTERRRRHGVGARELGRVRP
jgi:hypothetical protein